jgi:hypothetical protein
MTKTGWGTALGLARIPTFAPSGCGPPRIYDLHRGKITRMAPLPRASGIIESAARRTRGPRCLSREAVAPSLRRWASRGTHD